MMRAGAMQTINLLYSISGFAVGMLVGMTGVGGGSLMTPLHILLFGIHPATAVGTASLGLTALGVSAIRLTKSIARSVSNRRSLSMVTMW